MANTSDANYIDAASQSLFNAADELDKAHKMVVKAYMSADIDQLRKLEPAIAEQRVKVEQLRELLAQTFAAASK